MLERTQNKRPPLRIGATVLSKTGTPWSHFAGAGRFLPHARSTKRSQRLCLSTALCLGFFGPVSAQTVEEAAWSNAAIALQFCLSGQAAGATRAAWFRGAGFAETVERSTVNNDTTHTFTAPADTVQVELYYGEMPQHCSVTSGYMGVTRANQLMDALIPQVFPGFLRRQQQGEGAVCVTYEDPTNPIGMIIGVASDRAADCREDGSVVFYSTYRV